MKKENTEFNFVHFVLFVLFSFPIFLFYCSLREKNLFGLVENEYDFFTIFIPIIVGLIISWLTVKDKEANKFYILISIFMGLTILFGLYIHDHGTNHLLDNLIPGMFMSINLVLSVACCVLYSIYTAKSFKNILIYGIMSYIVFYLLFNFFNSHYVSFFVL